MYLVGSEWIHKQLKEDRVLARKSGGARRDAMNLPCPSCGTRNSNERQFCGECGHSMLLKCEHCQFCNTPGDKFCGGCGVMVAQAPAPPSSHVDFPLLPAKLRATIAGIDSPDSDELDLDTATSIEDQSETEFEAAITPEPDDAEASSNDDLIAKYSSASETALQEIPAKYMTLLRVDLKLAAGQSLSSESKDGDGDSVTENFAQFAQHTVEHTGGERLVSGQASLLWGFSDVDPVVAAQRATAAALELLSSVELFNFQEGCDFHLHTGLSTGQVQLDESCSPQIASGRVFGLSSKISSLAPSGSVYLCQHTFDCLDGAHRAELVGQVQEQETEATVAVHQLVLDQSVVESETPSARDLIGREVELGELEKSLQLALETEKGSWLMLSGAPGIGKTRLLEEFHQNASAHRAESVWYSIGNNSHAPRPCLLHVMAQQVASQRHPGLALEQVHQRIGEELLLSSDDQKLLAMMLNVETSEAPQSSRMDKQCDLLARLFSHRRSSPGMVLIIDDVHWATDSMKHRIGLLCDRLKDTPTVVLFSSRDCAEKSKFGITTDMPGAVSNLAGLSNEAAFELSSTFLPPQTPIVRQCVSRATGNPLFLTQQLQAAIDTIDSHAPGSLRGIVNAKMQRLASRELEQLQAAAILGSRVTLGAWSGLLGELPETCDTLLQHQLLFPDSAGYRFSHDLVHSVVYRSIEKDQLKDFHLRAAQYFDNNAEVAAWHFLKAGEPLSGVAQVLEAGTNALNRGELSRAATLLDALVEVDEAQLARQQRFQLHRLRGDCHTRRLSHQQALSSYEHAMLVADEGQEQSQTKLLMAACYGELHNTEAAMQLLGEVLAESRLNEMPLLETLALQQRAHLLFQDGRFSDAESDLRAGLIEVKNSGDIQTEIEISQSLGELLCRQGKVREAEQLLSEAHQQRDRQRHGAGWADRDAWLGQCLYFLGDVCGARDILQAAIEHAKTVGDQAAVLQARCLLGPVLLDLGEPASALANGKLAMAIVSDDKNDNLASMAMVAVGESQIRLGKYALGLQMLTQAWSRAEPSDAKFSTGPWALAALATVVQRDVEQRNLLAKGEHLLNSGAEGLSHFWFYRLAIQVALGGGDDRLARRYAKLLQGYENGQELPWVKQACAGLVEDNKPSMLVAPLD